MNRIKLLLWVLSDVIQFSCAFLSCHDELPRKSQHGIFGTSDQQPTANSRTFFPDRKYALRSIRSALQKQWSFRNM